MDSHALSKFIRNAFYLGWRAHVTRAQQEGFRPMPFVSFLTTALRAVQA